MKKRENVDIELPKLKLEVDSTKKIVKNRRLFKRLVLVLASFLVFFALYSIFIPTEKNILISGVRKVLNNIGIYTQEVKSVSITSDNYNEPGSWFINKSAEWTGLGTAQVRFNLNTVVEADEIKRDVILVLDISGSMTGGRLSMMKKDTIELIRYVLSTEGSRVALITFDTTSVISSGFTNNTNELVGLINSLEERNCTNYYEALYNVEKVLEGYEREDNRELITLFLTDGYPNIDTPNQIGQYHTLKEKYPYMSINGVQYEMGSQVVKELAEITDNQYIANMETLGNVLFNASVDPKYYEKIIISDYIEDEYWTVDNVNDIKVSKGIVSLEEENGVQKIVWTLGNGLFMTGEQASMTIDIKLKEQYVRNEGFYPTNKKEEIESKEMNKETKNITSTKTPVLKADYVVTYDSNLPANCGRSTKITEKHFAYENVTKSNTVLECQGYKFNGWEIVDDVKKVNDDIFIMPTKDVLIRGIWSKVSIDKAIDGTVKEQVTLYETVKNDVDLNRYARKYTGSTSTFNGKENVYYYYSASAANNVIFGNFCWKIVRTTDTGGVKLIYNGIPSSDGKCENTEANAQLTAAQMNTSSNTSRFNPMSATPSFVGYMYDPSYSVTTRNMSDSTLVISTEAVDTNTYTNIINDANKPFEYDETTKKWTSTNHDHNSKSTIEFSVNKDGFYYLEYTVSSEANYDLAKVYVDNVLKGTLGGSISGKLNLENITTSNVIKVEYSKDSSNSTGKDNIVFNLAGQSDGEMIDNRWLFGNSFEYNEGIYTLKNYKKVDFLNESAELANYHYTCFNVEGTCSKLGYIYRADEKTAYIMYVKGDEKIETSLEEMIYSKANKEDSTVKKAIDTWYKNYMLEYNDYLEDTVWCNNRALSRPGGWNPNGGTITTSKGDMYFQSNAVSNLTCPNLNDRFTVNEENGNGSLTYPVGLITKSEIDLSGKAIWSGSPYWTMSPFYFVQSNSCDYIAISSGVQTYCSVMDTKGVRPTISLRAGIKSSGGDGSADSPYIIRTVTKQT